MKLILLILMLLSTNLAVARPLYFSSIVVNQPREKMLVYGNNVVMQNLLKKRYVYTIPKNGEYLLDNGQNVTIRNGTIVGMKTIKFNQLFDLGMSEDSFFISGEEECNKFKFFAARNMFAGDCNIPFHLYQIIPIYPDFIRVAVVPSQHLFNNNLQCDVNNTDINELIKIENKTDEAIIQERTLQARQQFEALTSEEKEKLKQSIKQIKKLKPWEFGINDREIILGININKYEVSGNLSAFYVTYFNDIGCIPYPILKLASYQEYGQYKAIFMDNYSIVSEYKTGEDDKMIFIRLSGNNVIEYKADIIPIWKREIEDKTLKEVKNIN